MGKGGGAEEVPAAVTAKAAKTKAGGAEEVPAVAAAAATATAAKTKKTKKVMRRLPQDYVDSVLAMKPMQPARFPPGSEPKRISEECRRQSAKVNELIRGNEDHIRSIQEYYRRELDTKGYVEVEVDEDHIRSIQEYYRRELDTKGYVEVDVSDDGF